MKVIISEEALAAIRAIGDFIAQDDPQAAWAVEDAIFEKS